MVTGSHASALRITVHHAHPAENAPTGGPADGSGAADGDGAQPDTAGRAVVMTVRGNLDIDSAVRLRAALSGVLEASASRIVVDMGGLDFCDSIGLSTLVDAHRACLRHGGYLRLAAPSPFLVRVLDVVGLLGQLTVYDSVNAALTDQPPGGRPPPPPPDGPVR